MKANSKGASAQIVSPVLKCRKGDLAILLEGPCAGHIVEVAEYYATIEMDNGKVLVNAWQTKHPSHEPDTEYFKEDKYLLPIRPGDLEETEADGLGRKERDAREVQHG